MQAELFDKVLQLLPLLRPDGHLLFSCNFEPTIHPQFLDLLERVPSAWRSRGGFTTNLARRLPETFFERLLDLHLGYVNVSIDSLNPAVFEEMAKGAHFDVFRSNLDRLVEHCTRSQQPPELRFISMVSKLNLAEIPDLIRRCSELYKPKRHEIRGIWMTRELEQRPWIQSHAITADDMLALRRDLSNVPPHVDWVFDLPPNPQAYTRFPAKTEKSFRRFVEDLADPNLQRVYSVPLSPILQIASDGMVRFLTMDPDLAIDLKALEDPLPVVGQFLEIQSLSVARAAELKKSTITNLALKRVNLLNRWLQAGTLKFVSNSEKLAGYLDGEADSLSTSSTQRLFRLSGWARNPVGPGAAEEVILIARQGRKRSVVAMTVPEYERADVALALKDAALLHSGWVLELETHDLDSTFEGEVVFEAFAFDSDSRTGYRIGGERKAVFGVRSESRPKTAPRPTWPASVLTFLRGSK